MRTVLLLLAVLGGGLAHAEAPSAFDRFRLFNHCGPLDFVVEGLPTGASEIGLTESSLQAAVESRLRAARLFDEDVLPYLYLNVNVFGAAFSIDLRFNKTVDDVATDLRRQATTWQVGGTGTHGKNAGYIRSAVSEFMDQFLVEYLRVNEEACSS